MGDQYAVVSALLDPLYGQKLLKCYSYIIIIQYLNLASYLHHYCYKDVNVMLYSYYTCIGSLGSPRTSAMHSFVYSI